MKTYTNLNDFIEDSHAIFDNENDKTTKYMYFYKGTAFPVITTTPHENMMSMTYAFIIEALKLGQSLNVQANEYIKKLDEMKKVLLEGSKLPDLPENTPQRLLERHFNQPIQQLKITWFLCVCALTRLKKIKGKGLNGVVVFTPK
jgi:hypothetical protein